MTQLEARNCYLVPVIPVATLLTLLVLAGDAPTALRWGRRTAGDLHDFVVAEAEEAFDMVREIKRAPPVAIPWDRHPGLGLDHLSALGDNDSLKNFFEAIPGFLDSNLVKHLQKDIPSR
ncbi:hypothetical protein V8E52_006360 [Russula decolorans]